MSSDPLRHTQLQRWLAHHSYWDEDGQMLWVDARKFLAKHPVVQIPSWDRMMMQPGDIPHYPKDWTVFQWHKTAHLAVWLKPIPVWVRESCALFPTHQLTLLHYVGRYPQLLELLDHSPMLAWRLVSSGLSETDIVDLLSHKRITMAETLGWPGKSETIEFLRKLRLRHVNDELTDMVEVCVQDEHRLKAMSALPRINSMALTLAAHFPHLIGSHLHQSLARMPCRPMQCKGMMALLEDVYRLADYLALPPSEVARIGKARYLIEVEEIYQAWWKSTLGESDMLEQQSPENSDVLERSQLITRLALEQTPTPLLAHDHWWQLSHWQGHYWLTDAPELSDGRYRLLAWIDEEDVIGALIETESQSVLRVRRSQNRLPEATQLSVLYCHLAQDDASQVWD